MRKVLKIIKLPSRKPPTPIRHKTHPMINDFFLYELLSQKAYNFHVSPQRISFNLITRTPKHQTIIKYNRILHSDVCHSQIATNPNHVIMLTTFDVVYSTEYLSRCH